MQMEKKNRMGASASNKRLFLLNYFSLSKKRRKKKKKIQKRNFNKPKLCLHFNKNHFYWFIVGIRDSTKL